MTTGEFVQSKFSLFLLTFLTIFFCVMSLITLEMAVWYPKNAEMFASITDWFVKAAIGPLVGALISSIITPHEIQRREDSSEFASKNDTTVKETKTTETVTKPKVPPVEPIEPEVEVKP